MTVVVLICFTIVVVIIGMVRLVSLFKSAEDVAVTAEKEIIKQDEELIKECAEAKHDASTPQQLVDFFNRPHP